MARYIFLKFNQLENRIYIITVYLRPV